MSKLQVRVGWDSREAEAYDVLNYSIKKHCKNVEIEPIIQSELRRKGIYNRPTDKLGSTEFSLTRFLTPKLVDYSGWALFVDCDFLCTRNLTEVFEYADPKYAVLVVKHCHWPPEKTKMDNQIQTQYEKKNWSSCILFNCAHEKNKSLTPEVINSVEPKYLHRFWWLDETKDIGELPIDFNFLVGYYKPWEDKIPLFLHYTNGMPFMYGYGQCDYSDIWYRYRDEMMKERYC